MNLTGKIDIPTETKVVGYSAFANCKSIASVVFHQNDTVEWIGSERVPWSGTIEGNAFSNCSSLTSVTLAGSMKTIGDYAFDNCSSLETLVLPEGVKHLGSYMIRGTRISSITIPSTVTESGEYWTNGALAGCPALTKVTFAPGTKTIPAYICASESQTSYIQTVELPDSVEEIGEYAFYACVNLESIYLPAALYDLPVSTFEETSIELIHITTEDSQVAITLIDLEIPYIADEIGIKDSSIRFLDRSNTRYHSSTGSVTAAGQIALTLQYDFKQSVKSRVSNLEMMIKLPAAESIAPNSLLVNGMQVDYDEDEEGHTMFSLNEPSGVVTFYVSPQNTVYLMSYAQIYFDLDGTRMAETVGIVNLGADVLTLYVPTESSNNRIVASGVAMPHQQVSIYLDGTLTQTVTASATGNYFASLILPAPTEGKKYQVEARAIDSNEKTVSVTAFVTYRLNAATLTAFEMYYRGNQYNLLNMGSKSPVISWANGEPFTFVMDFDDCRKVGTVQVVSAKGGEESVLEAIYDEKQDRFIATGFADYVPGTIYVEYAEQETNPYEGSSVRFINATQGLDLTNLFEFHIVLPDESTECYYLIEHQTDASFDFGAKEYVQGTYEGKTCYMTLEPFQYEKDGGYYYAFELYVSNGDGKYTMTRCGVGLHEEASLQSAEQLNDLGDMAEVWDKAQALYELLTDQNVSTVDEMCDNLEKHIQLERSKATDANDRRLLDDLSRKLIEARLYNIGTESFRKLNKISSLSFEFADDPEFLSLASDKMQKELDKSYKAMEKVSKAYTNKALKQVIDELIKRSQDQANTKLEQYKYELEHPNKQSNAKFRGKYSIDPSGYVYEAVSGNRVSGVSATIYYKESMESSAIVWDAGEYDQFNPVLTDQDGCYAWDVPEGYWQVKFEKFGYETAYSDWLPVPPPQLDVNIGIQSKSAPEILLINAYAEAIEIVFSQYIDVKTVNKENIIFEAGGSTIDGTWKTVNAEPSASNSSVNLATTFRFIPLGSLSGNVSYTIGNVRNYTGRVMDSQSGTLAVKLDIKSVQTMDQIEVAYGTSRTLMIQALPKAAAVGKQVRFTCNNPYLLSVDASATFDENGTAAFSVTSLLPGVSTVRYEITGTSYSGEIIVSSTMDSNAAYTVNVVNGSGSGDYTKGESVTITARAAEAGEHFVEWSGTDGLTFISGNKTTETATFMMPANDVRVEAVFETIASNWKVNKTGASEVVIQCENADAGGWFLFATYDENGQFLHIEIQKAVAGSTFFKVIDENAASAMVLWVDEDYKPMHTCEKILLK